MADKRMLSKSIIDSDKFLSMPTSARMLYVDLAVRADDDGFITPRRVMKVTGASDDDLRILISRRYLLPICHTDCVLNDRIPRFRSFSNISSDESVTMP